MTCREASWYEAALEGWRPLPLDLVRPEYYSGRSANARARRARKPEKWWILDPYGVPFPS